SRGTWLTPLPYLRVAGQRRRRTHGQSPRVLTTAPTSGASLHLQKVAPARLDGDLDLLHERDERRLERHLDRARPRQLDLVDARPVRLVSASGGRIRAWSGVRFLISNGNSRFWRRLRHGSRFASWKITPISSGRGPVTGVPSRRMRPVVSWCRPDIPQSSVVLP